MNKQKPINDGIKSSFLGLAFSWSS